MNAESMDKIIGCYSVKEFEPTFIQYCVANVLMVIEGTPGALLMFGGGILSIACWMLSRLIDPAYSRRLNRLSLILLLAALITFLARYLVILLFGVEYPDSGGTLCNALRPLCPL